jgi:hypothetical protein
LHNLFGIKIGYKNKPEGGIKRGIK